MYHLTKKKGGWERRGLLTQIEATHEDKFVVHYEQLLMMSPKEDRIVACSVKRLENILRSFGEIERPQGEVLEAGLDLGGNVDPAGVVVGMTEDLDVPVQSFESMFGVLCVIPCLSISKLITFQRCKIRTHTSESTADVGIG